MTFVKLACIIICQLPVLLAFQKCVVSHFPMSVDLLILGAGWTSTFLIPLCDERGIQVAATSRSGRDGTIPFVFNPESDDTRPYEALPDAKTILVSFPIKTTGASQRLVTGYLSTRRGAKDKVGFIQLGATSIWDVSLELMHSLSRFECLRPYVSEWAVQSKRGITPGVTETRHTIRGLVRLARMNYLLYHRKYRLQS